MTSRGWEGSTRKHRPWAGKRQEGSPTGCPQGVRVIINVSKPMECTTARPSPKLYPGLWVLMTRPRQFISCDTRASLLRDVFVFVFVFFIAKIYILVSSSSVPKYSRCDNELLRCLSTGSDATTTGIATRQTPELLHGGRRAWSGAATGRQFPTRTGQAHGMS